SDGFATSRIAVRRQYCPTVQFVGGEFFASGAVRADRASRTEASSSGTPGPTFVTTRAWRWVEDGEPGHQEVYAEFNAEAFASITQFDDTTVLRIQADAVTYAWTSEGFGSSEANGTVQTVNDAGQPSPILVTIPEPMELVTINAQSTGTADISLLDATGQPVTEGRLDAGVYELHASVSAGGVALPPSGYAEGMSSLDWSFTLLSLACRADLDGDGQLTIFDFLAFQNAFDAGDLVADFDGDGELTLFDFLAFQNEFDAGCG
ncbi:MAG: GC-type dockerin domain-anchored protein, partial [Phycisphaerales bacterium JB064]